MEDEPPIREFMDRGTIWLLGSNTTLRQFVELAARELAGHLAFERAVRVNRSFIPYDLKKRETDVVYLIPYRDRAGEVLVYIVVEHQSEADPEMGLRLFHVMDLLWQNQRRSFLDENLPASRWRLHPVISFVFYTGEPASAPPRGMLDLMDAPTALLPLIPQFEILYLGLHELPDERLRTPGGALGWLFRVLRKAGAPLEELSGAVTEAVSFLETLPEEAQGEWARAMHYLLLLVRHKREPEERQGLYERILLSAERHRVQIEEMVMTDAQVILEKGRQEGRQEGREEGWQEGIREGALAASREALLRGRKFGPPDEATLAAINSLTSIKRLEEMMEQVMDVSDWRSLFQVAKVSSRDDTRRDES